MGFLENLSKHKLAARWLVAVILVVGFFLQRAPQAIALASVAYFAIEGHRVQSVAGHRGTSVSELVKSSGWFLRRGFIWTLLAVVVFFDLLAWDELTLTIISGVLLYVAGVFSQAVSASEDEYRPEERPPEDEYPSEDERQPSRTGPTGE